MQKEERVRGRVKTGGWLVWSGEVTGVYGREGLSKLEFALREGPQPKFPPDTPCSTTPWDQRFPESKMAEASKFNGARQNCAQNF